MVLNACIEHMALHHIAQFYMASVCNPGDELDGYFGTFGIR